MLQGSTHVAGCLCIYRHDLCHLVTGLRGYRKCLHLRLTIVAGLGLQADRSGGSCRCSGRPVLDGKLRLCYLGMSCSEAVHC